LLIENGRIARIGPAAALASETADVVIDGRGRSVMPGLVMLHEHLLFLDSTADAPTYLSEPLSSPRAYLAYGATTIRTGGTFNGSDDLRVARGIRDGQIAGPDILVTAPFIEGEGSFAFQMTPITDPARARRVVDFWADEGATSYKIYMNVSRAVLAAVVVTHGPRTRVTGHLCSVTFARRPNWASTSWSTASSSPPISSPTRSPTSARPPAWRAAHCLRLRRTARK
jgi:enamidase